MITAALIKLKIQQRLNKLASGDYDNLEDWQIAEAFNKAQLGWLRRQIEGLNSRQTGDEGSTVLMDDLQVILTHTPVLTPMTQDYLPSADVFAKPGDYLGFKAVHTLGKPVCCPARRMVVTLATVAQQDMLLRDEHHCPSVEWGETFCTVAGNTIRVFHDQKFTLQNTRLDYYRMPSPLNFAGQDGTPSAESLPEFKDDIVEVLLDECTSILAADLENTLQANLSAQRTTAQA